MIINTKYVFSQVENVEEHVKDKTHQYKKFYLTKKKMQFIYTDYQERKDDNLNNIAVKSQVFVLGLNENELVLNDLYLVVTKT